MEILKRILLAIVVLPLSFVVVGFLAAVLIGFFVVLFDILHLNPSEAFHNSTDFVANVQTAWQAVTAQYTKDPAAYTSSIWDAAQVSFKKNLPTIETVAAIYAALGAIIFFLSCFGHGVYLALLTSRRIITVPLVFTYSLAISLVILYLVVINICLIIVRTASVPGQEIKNIADFHANYDSFVIEGVVTVALVIAIYVSYRLTRWDGLPWCRNPLPVQPQRRSARKP